MGSWIARGWRRLLGSAEGFQNASLVIVGVPVGVFVGVYLSPHHRWTWHLWLLFVGGLVISEACHMRSMRLQRHKATTDDVLAEVKATSDNLSAIGTWLQDFGFPWQTASVSAEAHKPPRPGSGH